MRGKLTDQDLTNYALNDGLEARERFYVESMLGANEECRGDVYKMLDLAQALERGFEMESNRTVPRLTRDQRTQLLTAKPKFELLPFVRRSAAALSLAACVAFVISNPSGWQFQSRTGTMAAMTTGVSRMVTDVISSDSEEDDYTMWVSPQALNEDDSTYIQASSDGMPADEAICTPPTGGEAVETADAQ